VKWFGAGVESLVVLHGVSMWHLGYDEKRPRTASSVGLNTGPGRSSAFAVVFGLV